MPAAHDLTGQRFGRLLVLRENGRVKFGREQTAWLVECNCGRQETVAQALLTQRGWRECSHCQRPVCVVCGEKVPASRPRSVTCSDTCHQAKRRDQGLDRYHRMAADPQFNRSRYQRLQQRMASDPDLAARIQQIHRSANARWRTNPENREAIRRYQALHYAMNREAIQQRRRDRLDAMTPTQLERWRARIRNYDRVYRAHWQERLRADPDRHRAYLDLMREYRRRAIRTAHPTAPAPNP